VAKVVEPERREAGPVSRRDVPAPECGRVEAIADDVREHVVVGAREVRAARQAVERTQRLVPERE
jgi:hypothetical protein